MTAYCQVARRRPGRAAGGGRRTRRQLGILQVVAILGHRERRTATATRSGITASSLSAQLRSSAAAGSWLRSSAAADGRQSMDDE